MRHQIGLEILKPLGIELTQGVGHFARDVDFEDVNRQIGELHHGEGLGHLACQCAWYDCTVPYGRTDP